MKIGYVCTNFNNSRYSREAVCSLVRSIGDQCSIVLVDNNSDRDNVEALKQLAREFQQVDLVLSSDNLGYFRGLNKGIRQLRSAHPEIDIVVVGNNDLIFPADFAE